MTEQDQNYTFPWGFNLGNLHKNSEIIPLYTATNDGGFSLLYDKVSESKVDKLLESLCLELLSQMPAGSLRVNMFDFGKKKFYHLSALQFMECYKTAYTPEMMMSLFDELEKTIVTRYEELICCNRPSINEHNKKSKLKEMYHLVLINLANFPTEDISLRRINNFVESAQKAGVYVIAFGYQNMEESKNENVQTVLNYFKKIQVTEGNFGITKEIFEFVELLDDHEFRALDLDKSSLMQETLKHIDLETYLNPESIKLEENTRVE